MTTYDTRPPYTDTDSAYRRYPGNGRRGLGDLFSDLSADAARLARQEVQLAKVEMEQKARAATGDIALVVAGIFLANAALLALVATAVFALALTMELWLAALIVGLVVALVAGLLVWRGIANLREIDPVPQQTINSLEEDKEWLTRQIR